ncbi:MAG TPA: FxLYD domain-containing protein [Kaistia sp.]|nr:FxLYD domain-containing protein [Kaistia sp.]
MANRIEVEAAGRWQAWDGRTLVALALLVAVAGGAVLCRKPLVAAAPGLAGLYRHAGLDVNRTGLAFDDVHTLRDVADGAAGLVVEGAIRNVTDAAVDVPPLRLVLIDGAGERVGGWQAEPDQRRLDAGASQKFRTRLAAPPDPARKVSVSFALPGTKG